MFKLVLSIAAAGLLLAGCGSLTAGTGSPTGTAAAGAGAFPATPAAGTPTTPANPRVLVTPPRPIDTPVSPDAVKRALRARTGSDAVLVPIRTGYQALAFEQIGRLSFWQYGETTGWTRIGGSTFPYLAANSPRPSARGTVLAHMTNATFIVAGAFSGDGTGNAIAYTANAIGQWGAIKAESSGNIGPSGQGVDPSDNIGLADGFYFADGELETADCSDTTISADCGGNQRVLKFWEWNGQDFTLVRHGGLDH